MHLILPFLLDVFQDNLKVTKESPLRFGSLFVCQLETLIDKVSDEHFLIRKELRKRGIKVFDIERNKIELKAEYLCRGYTGKMVLLMNLIKAELSLKIAHYLNINITNIS